MNLIKQLFVAGFLLTTNLTQAIYWANFDYKTYYKYIGDAHEELQKVASHVQCIDHGNLDILWTGKSYADALYPKQKAALEAISEQIKANNDPRLSSHFEYEVCQQWERIFNNNYEASMKNGDWDWVHRPIPIWIHE